MIDHLIDLEALLDRFQVERCLVLGWSLKDSSDELSQWADFGLPQLLDPGSHPPISWQDNLYTGVASILNRLQPAGWTRFATLYRYLIQQHTPTAYRYLAFEAMSAYLKPGQPSVRWVPPSKLGTTD